jgi:hypothetical protein
MVLRFYHAVVRSAQALLIAGDFNIKTGLGWDNFLPLFLFRYNLNYLMKPSFF